MAKKKIGESLLGGKFSYNSETTVVCKYCKAEFKYHRSTSSLMYHLRSKHAFASTPSPIPSTSTSDLSPIFRQSTLVELQERAKPMDQGKTNHIKIYFRRIMKSRHSCSFAPYYFPMYFLAININQHYKW